MRARMTCALMCTILTCGIAGPASAQSVDAAAPASGATPLTPEESAALGNALLFDPSTWAAPAKPLHLPNTLKPQVLDFSRSDKSDDSSSVVLKKPFGTEWDTKVGADLGVAAQQPTDGYRPDRPLPGSRNADNSGAAWASVGAPNFATVDARVDPANDQGKLGTTIKQSISVGSHLALTLQNTFSVTENLGAPTPGPSDVPLMTRTSPTGTSTPQIWSNEKLARFDVLSTGTTFAAGLNTTSIDPVTHNKLSAEQKLYGPLHVTTAITDLGQPVPNKSISAGFKLNW